MTEKEHKKTFREAFNKDKVHQIELTTNFIRSELDVIIADCHKPDFSNQTLTNTSLFLIQIVCDKIIDLNHKEGFNLNTSIDMGMEFAEKLTDLIKIYSNVDINSPQGKN